MKPRHMGKWQLEIRCHDLIPSVQEVSGVFITSPYTWDVLNDMIPDNLSYARNVTWFHGNRTQRS